MTIEGVASDHGKSRRSQPIAQMKRDLIALGPPWLYHVAASTAYALRPVRLRGFPEFLRAVLAYYVTPPELRQNVPDGTAALSKLDGFAGICPDVSVETLMRGYRAGLYQTSHLGPYKWWAPKDRMVLFMDRLHLEKNLKRKLRQDQFKVTFDQAFAEVVAGCAGHHENRRVQLTWLTPPVQDAFFALHSAGHAHSVEVWQDGKLSGGLFGVSFGRVFATESQFSAERDASKIAFAVLNRHLQSWGYVANDLRRWTPHLAKLGGETIPRDAFRAIANTFGTGSDPRADWKLIPDLAKGSWDPPSQTGWRRDDVEHAIASITEVHAATGDDRPGRLPAGW